MSNTSPADEQVLPDPVPPESEAEEAPQTTPQEESPEEVIDSPSEEKAPAEFNDEQAVLQKRLSGALQENEKRSAELKKALRLQSDMVRESPNYIHRIAEEDPSMANKVIQDVWGDSGIRSYKQLQEHIKLQSLKETDPETYETKKELLEVKSKLEDKELREQTKAKKEFLKSKGIQENSYDPMYQKIENALSMLNPKVVKDDFEKALELAYRFIEDPTDTTPSPPKPTLNVGGGTPAVPPIKPSAGRSEFSWAYEQWKKQNK